MFVHWNQLSLKEAKKLTALLEEQRPAALAWLEEQMGDPIPRDAEGLNRAWHWYLTWKDTPRSCAITRTRRSGHASSSSPSAQPATAHATLPDEEVAGRGRRATAYRGHWRRCGRGEPASDLHAA